MKAKLVTAMLIILTLAAWAMISSCDQLGTVERGPHDPLPSWKDGSTKQAIRQFVEAVTNMGGDDYVPMEQRIAVFDNDGTLWCEQPLVQGLFILYRLQDLATADPSLGMQQPFKSALEGDAEYLKAAGWTTFLELAAATHAGISQEGFAAEVEEFFAFAQHPELNLPVRQLAYQPMLELLAYLRTNGFKTYICSGGGMDFMRVFSNRLYGIPPEQVIGSSMKKELRQVGSRWVLTRTGKLNDFNDKEAKPENIDLHIGTRPLLAVGNVRTGGDIDMLHYSQGRKGPSLQLLVNHDDEQREFAYAEEDNASLNAAQAYGWPVVSMKNDWMTVFSKGE